MARRRGTSTTPYACSRSDTPESDLGGSPSPRTALLSPLPETFDLPGQQSRGPSRNFRRRRERAHSSATRSDLIRLLISEEYETRKIRRVLYTMCERLEQETGRSLDAERRLEGTVARAKTINDARIAAQQEAARAQEELRLYKLQLENAQNEIIRAQNILTAVEAQRDDAEAVAASARSKARKLNEERLIELAREEGRRLGFEEGIRRGRRMGYREGHAIGIDAARIDMDGIAANAVDRLLATRDELEEESEPREPPQVNAVRPPPDIVRAHTPSMERRAGGTRGRHNSETESTSTLRRMPAPIPIPASPVGPPPDMTTSVPSAPSTASHHSRPPSGFSRPMSVHNEPAGVDHTEMPVPPDGYIPTADANFNITLPPPHELQRNMPSPTPSQRTIGPTPEQEGVKMRDFAYEPFRHPPARRASTDSAASTRLSASTISQLGDLVGLPGNGQRRRERDRDRQGLSVIHEDASMRSERSSDHPPTAVPSQPGLHRHDSLRSGRDAADSEATLRRQDSHRDRRSKQRLADELRYSDPAAVEEWRRHGADKSGPPSDAPSRGTIGAVTSGLLSPDHANMPLPIPPPTGPTYRSSSPVPLVPTVPNSPVNPNLAFAGYGQGQNFNVLPDGQFAPGFAPSSGSIGSGAGGVGQGPVIPQNLRPGLPRYSLYGPPQSQPISDPRERERDRARGQHVMPERERERSSRTRDVPAYPTSPTPTGLTYPPPPISRAPSRPESPSQSTLDERRRSGAGIPPTSRSQTPRPASGRYSVPPDAVSGTGPPVSSSKRYSIPPEAASATGTNPRYSIPGIPPTTSSQGSNPRFSVPGRTSSQGSQSRGGYGRYDPQIYNDPAYLSSRESLDAVTDANTAANAGRSGRMPGSPSHGYERLR
ncbi:hypothetical protein ID866_5807 [Astraeus odoratus]|nr:hypothetical protein ID866_5807 [Astraeus odoratus]